MAIFRHFYATMHMIFDLVQTQRKVKSDGTAPEIDAYGTLIDNSYSVPGSKFQVLTASLAFTFSDYGLGQSLERWQMFFGKLFGLYLVSINVYAKFYQNIHFF